MFLRLLLFLLPTLKCTLTVESFVSFHVLSVLFNSPTTPQLQPPATTDPLGSLGFQAPPQPIIHPSSRDDSGWSSAWIEEEELRLRTFWKNHPVDAILHPLKLHSNLSCWGWHSIISGRPKLRRHAISVDSKSWTIQWLTVGKKELQGSNNVNNVILMAIPCYQYATPCLVLLRLDALLPKTAVAGQVLPASIRSVWISPQECLQTFLSCDLRSSILSIVFH